MNVVKSASLNTIEDASHVFERTGSDEYTLIKARTNFEWCVGKTYTRANAEYFASWNPGTLIIEGGYDMNTNNQRTITKQVSLVTIPKEVADAIVSLRKLGWGNVELTKAAVNGNYTGEYTSVIVGYASPNLETLLSALVNGYIIEKSAEELAHDKIRKQYQYHRAESFKAASCGGYYNGYTEAVEDTLGSLGIIIEGVNA